MRCACTISREAARRDAITKRARLTWIFFPKSRIFVNNIQVVLDFRMQSRFKLTRIGSSLSLLNNTSHRGVISNYPWKPRFFTRLMIVAGVALTGLRSIEVAWSNRYSSIIEFRTHPICIRLDFRIRNNACRKK